MAEMVHFRSCFGGCGQIRGQKHNDMVVNVVLQKYEQMKRLLVRIDEKEGELCLCAENGAVLKTILLRDIDMSLCCLPGHTDCVCIKYINPQSQEIILEAKNGDSLGDLLRRIQGIQPSQQNGSEDEAHSSVRGVLSASGQSSSDKISFIEKQEKKLEGGDAFCDVKSIETFQADFCSMQLKLEQEVHKVEMLTREKLQLIKDIQFLKEKEEISRDDIRDYTDRIRKFEKENFRLAEELAVLSSKYKDLFDKNERVKHDLLTAEKEKMVGMRL